MQLRKYLEIGYVLHNGYVMNSYDIAAYNRIQERINACLLAGLPVSETLLNASHHLIAIRINTP